MLFLKRITGGTDKVVAARDPYLSYVPNNRIIQANRFA